MNKMSRKAFLKLAAAATALAVSPQLAFAQGASNWEAEWKKIAEAAKKEGELNLAISFGLGGLPKNTLAEFEKRFGVKVNMQRL